LYKEIIFKKLTVREAESVARKIAFERVRKHNSDVDPDLMAIENKLKESLGTQVRIERKEKGGKITIDFFSDEDLQSILDIMNRKQSGGLSPEKIEGGVVSTDSPVDDRSLEEIKTEEENEDLYSLKNFSL